KQGANWVIYTVSVFAAPTKWVKEGQDPSELFRFSVAETCKSPASGAQAAIVFIKEPSSQDALQGRRALLRCEVEAPAPVHVYWLLNGAPVQDTERRFVQDTERRFPQVSSLSFTAVDRLQDSGAFQCVARDNVTGEEARSANASFNIKWIEGGPVVLKQPASEAEIQPQTQVTLRCHVDGHPRPTYQWFRDGTPLSDGQSNHTVSSKERNLTLRPATPEHSGVYSCCAHNAFGQACSSQNFTLNIADESFARVVLAPQDLVVARNEEAMFHCQFSAQPAPSLQWVFEDDTPISNRSRPQHLRRATVFATGPAADPSSDSQRRGLPLYWPGQRGPPVILKTRCTWLVGPRVWSGVRGLPSMLVHRDLGSSSVHRAGGGSGEGLVWGGLGLAGGGYHVP
uniref:Protein tyrosine kinase 7 (inactive) n=1 Tax=Oryctolagus cuniculus TaxID=9986 RepID=A0A5F9DC16_RABIT